MNPGELTIIEMPMAQHLSFSRPERTALDFTNTDQLAHIWTFAYLKRIRRVGKPKEWPIEESSLSSERKRTIPTIIVTLSELMILNGWAGKTAHRCFVCIRSFMDWADENALSKGLWLNFEETTMAFDAFSQSLRLKAAKDGKQRNAALTQQGILAFGQHLFSEDFGRGVFRIKPGSSESTRVPDDAALSAQQYWAETIFTTATYSVIENRALPLAFPHPDSAMGVIWFIPNGVSRKRALTMEHAVNWNVQTGQPRSMDELVQIYTASGVSFPKVHAQQAVRNCRQLLEKVNGNARHPQRLRLASMATACFAMLLAGVEGANESIIEALEMTDSMISDLRNGNVTRAKFRQLKLRARGAEVQLSVGYGLIQHLRLYLDLRAYILNGRTSALLLVYPMENNEPSELAPGWFIKKFKRTIALLGIDLGVLGTRKLRAAKQDYLIRTVPVEVAATLMGHSIATALRSYTNGSQARNISEMSTYLSNVQDVVSAGKHGLGETENAVGTCISYGNPIAIVSEVPVQPTCQSTEGCLFCKSYRIYADEVDARKLLSMRYCLRFSFSSSGDLDFTELVLSPTLVHIDYLIGEISRVNSSLIKRIESEVDDEDKLDPFWASKMEQLVALGLS